MASDSRPLQPWLKTSTIWLAFFFLMSSGVDAQETRPASRAARNLDVRWIHGSEDPAANQDPPLQVHRFDDATWILRQSKSVHFEAPFLYLLAGSKRVLLIDTGATSSEKKLPLRETVQGLVAGWVR